MPGDRSVHDIERQHGARKTDNVDFVVSNESNTGSAARHLLLILGV